jgi:type II secretion system protein I
MSRYSKQQAFTFIEVMAALAVVSIALVALLRLQLGTIGMCDRSEAILQASQLAQCKLSEMQAQGFPALGTTTGVDKARGRPLTWRVSVSPAQGQPDVGLRTIAVQVVWDCGSGVDSLDMKRTVASRILP